MASPVSGVGTSDSGGGSMPMNSMMALGGMAIATGMVATGVGRFGKRPDIARKLGLFGVLAIIGIAMPSPALSSRMYRPSATTGRWAQARATPPPAPTPTP
jgi:hypothetical protein